MYMVHAPLAAHRSADPGGLPRPGVRQHAQCRLVLVALLCPCFGYNQ
jgi:hypothetical protein